jgi:hypothetical protein
MEHDDSCFHTAKQSSRSVTLTLWKPHPLRPADPVSANLPRPRMPPQALAPLGGRGLGPLSRLAAAFRRFR